MILFVHHPIAFLGRFLMFLGFTQAYERYQAPLIIKEALLERFATDPPDLNDFSLLTSRFLAEFVSSAWEVRKAAFSPEARASVGRWGHEK